MANTFASPPTLPDATNAEVGDFIGAAEFTAAVDTSNWLIGRLRQGFAGQGWPDGQCSDNTNARKSGVARWRLPIQPGQATWTIDVYASASGAADAGEVRFSNGAGVLSLAINAIADGWYSGTLAVPAADYDTIVMDLTGHTTTSGTTVVREVCIRPTALTSPLAAAVVGTATPLGAAQTLTADDSLPAWVGHALRANVAAFRDDYPRQTMFWSALVGLTGSTGTPNTSMPAYLHQWWLLANPGAAERGKATAKVHAYAVPDGAVDEHVRMNVLGADSPGVEVVEVTAGGGVAWFIGEFRAAELRPALGASLPYQHHKFAVRPGVAADGRTTAELRSLCAWME